MRIGARRAWLAVLAAALLVVAVLWIRAPDPGLLPAPDAPAIPPAIPPAAPPADPPVLPSPPAELPALPLPSANEAPAPAISPGNDIEAMAFELTNEVRIRGGLPALEHDAVLDAAARAHSEDMLQRGFFAHVDPDGHGPADRVAQVSGLPGDAVGENIWMWSGSTHPARRWLAEQAVAAWAASPAHRENILRPGYTHLGVGAAYTGGDVRLTQLFRE